MGFDPQDYDVKPIGDAGLTERTVLDGSERILVQSGPDENVDTTPMEFVKFKTIQAKIDTLKGTGWAGQTVKGNADAIALRELLANKVASFQAEPDDTHYPTEKLVKDALDLLDERIDNIIASSGTSDTEVVDARLSGSTGVLYTLLKNRLDAMESSTPYFDADGGYAGRITMKAINGALTLEVMEA